MTSPHEMTLEEAGLVFVNADAYTNEALFHAAATKLRREDPVHWVEHDRVNPFYVITKHADVLDLELHPTEFLNAPRAILGTKAADQRRETEGHLVKSLVQMDDPEHRLHRQLTAEWFLPKNLAKLNDRLDQLAALSVQRLVDLGGQCDFARDIAMPYPLHVILAILGLPESDHPRMLKLTQELFGADDAEFKRDPDALASLMQTVADFVAYFDGITADRQAHPTDDLASVIANGQIQGKPIGHSEQLGYYIITATGHDTTSNAMSGGLHALIENPAETARLQADHSLLTTAVDEIIRWTSPVKHFMRTATCDYQVNGTTIKQGQDVLMSYPNSHGPRLSADSNEWISTMTSPDRDISAIVERARDAFNAGRTRSLQWRRSTLLLLRDLIAESEEELMHSVASDFGKPRLEAFATEVGFMLFDIDHVLAHLDSWMRPEKVPTPVLFQPGSSSIVPEPLGVVCVIAPWNYPMQLLLVPMIAAIAAGNAVVGKPSELTPHTSTALAKLVGRLGEPAVSVIEGGVPETTELLTHRFDHIFYTGNGRVGRVVMQAAVEHLTPVTLELGGKSPVIVSRHAKIDVAAKRIVWGKFLNAGQTCIAPDYVLVERPVHDEFVRALGTSITEFYGTDPQRSPDLARIVNDAHFNRLEKLLHGGTIAAGGQSDPVTRYIAPTVVTGITRDDAVMQEEIFGPILPVIAVDSLDEAMRFVNADDKPLALYTFSEHDEDNELVVTGTSSGGVCVNGTIMHISNPHLPFGGVGASGMGAYHGKFGFETFSHRRSVHTRSTRIDPPILYPPYTAKKEALLRRGMGIPDPRDLAAKLTSRLRRR